MEFLKGKELQKRIHEDDALRERYFVDYTRRYFTKHHDKILAIGGLRGTGKTTGLLQSLKGLDAVYLCAGKEDTVTGNDYIKILKNVEEKYIVIDEYSWIKDRKELDYFLFTCIQNGKRIAITGTESITLEFLNYGNLIHRIEMIHVTLLSYDEYLYVFNYPHSADNCDKYLIEGGIFGKYVINNYESMMYYIKVAIIDNLVDYFSSIYSTYDEQLIRQAVYSILYEEFVLQRLADYLCIKLTMHH